MKFLRIEKSLTSAENVVLTITNRREGATLLNCEECHSIEVRIADLFVLPEMPAGCVIVDHEELVQLEDSTLGSVTKMDDLDPAEVKLGTIQGL